MPTMPPKPFPSFSLALLAITLACGCAAKVGDQEEPVQASALALTACDGASISAAVSAGGDVALDCGTSPITIQMPPTTVTHATRLHAVWPGTITFTQQAGTLFGVSTPVSFEIDDIKFNGQGLSVNPVHSVTGTVILRGDSFDQYRSFVVSVHQGSSLTVANCSFTGNTGSNFAAPIYGEGGTTTVTTTTFTGNVSSGTGGTIVQQGGTLTVSGSTFFFNGASQGGAIAFPSGGTHLLTNNTFASNSGSSSAGAVYAIGASVTMRNNTFAENRSPQGTIFSSAGVSFLNNIVVDSVNPTGTVCNLTGSSNIQWPYARCAGFRTANPLLGGLANNGGPTATMALSAGSAAIDTATTACPATDQRGVARPRDGDGNGTRVCDVGAYER